MKPLILTLILTLLITGSARLDDSKKNSGLYEKKNDKERVYKVPYDKLWGASMKAASEGNVIDYSDKETGIITYKSGMSMSSWGFRISVSLTKIDEEKTRIKLVTQKTEKQLFAWGAGGRTAEKFFNGLDRILTEQRAKGN